MLFVKAILRAEMGEIWTSRNLKRVPAYAPNGRLMRDLLNAKTAAPVAAGRGQYTKSNQGFKDELLSLVKGGKAKAMYSSDIADAR